MGLAIKIEDLSKAYRIGQFNTGALSHDLERWWAQIRGKEDPFLKIGETNDPSIKSSSNIVWSLKDINLEIEQGDTIGIIGKNGSGKSTLLKVLSRVTSPTAGNIKIKGRVASLLEVGTGFHPELTGRENIFLNGSILGMRKGEIKKRFDEIVDFAGIKRYLDTPVKRYSSGMYVRLAFAVAAHLESEILIVDEVLAVGDVEFQKKCLGKMGDIRESEGRTILFVSHNMNAVRNLCNKGMILVNGLQGFHGDASAVVAEYLSEELLISSKSNFKENNRESGGPKTFSELLEIQLCNHNGDNAEVLFKGDQLVLIIKFRILLDVFNIEIGFTFKNKSGNVVSGSVSNWDNVNFDFKPGDFHLRVDVPEIDLLPGQYSIDLWIKYKGLGIDHEVHNAISFLVEESANNNSYVGFERYFHLNLHKKCQWQLIH